MSANSFGERFKIHSFGESHGIALGAVIDGCPAGLEFDLESLEQELSRRRPGDWNSKANRIVSSRKEMDMPEVLSGVFEGKTLGTPIAIIVRNSDQRSKDYEKIKAAPRAGHADDVWRQKFGHSDFRGGGRSSGRETIARVIGGAVAKMLLKKKFPKLSVRGFAQQMGPYQLTEMELLHFLKSNNSSDNFPLRFPSHSAEEAMSSLRTAQSEGESWGGVAKLVVQNTPKNFGQPVFHKLKSDLASAYMSVGATSGVDLGDGFRAASETGTKFHSQKGSQYGGIRGGISTGENIIFRVSFKPTSSILDVAKSGRHDPCIVTRAIPVLEAMTYLVLADHYLWSLTDRV